MSSVLYLTSAYLKAKNSGALSSWGRWNIFFSCSFGLVFCFPGSGQYSWLLADLFSLAFTHKTTECINPLVRVFLTCWVCGCDSLWFLSENSPNSLVPSFSQLTNNHCLPAGCETLHHSPQRLDGAVDRIGPLHFVQLGEWDNKHLIYKWKDEINTNCDRGYVRK